MGCCGKNTGRGDTAVCVGEDQVSGMMNIQDGKREWLWKNTEMRIRYCRLRRRGSCIRYGGSRK